MRKRLLSLMLVLTMLLLFAPCIAGAQFGIQYGDYLYYVDDGLGVTITDCEDDVVTAVIPEEIDGLPVTRIGNYAFDGCSSLTRIDIPDSVTSIDVGAFYNCSSLTSVIVNKETHIANMVAA